MSEPMLIPDKDLQWLDEVSTLLPEESRLGWYQNVRPWLRMLPPEDEVAHLAYSMGYLALLTRSTPALITAERAQLVPMLQRHIEEMTAAVKSTTALHRKLDDRLSRLPGEIAAGLNPDALVAVIVARVREQFLASGIPVAGRLLQEQGDDFRKMVAEQSRTVTALQQKLDDSGSSAERAYERFVKMSDTAENSKSGTTTCTNCTGRTWD